MIQRRILMNLLKKHGLAKKDDDVTNKTDDKHDGLIMIRKIYNDPNYEFDPEDHYLSSSDPLFGKAYVYKTESYQ